MASLAAVVQGLGLGGPLDLAVPAAAGMATLGAIVWGIRTHRPHRPLPWWLLVAAIVLLLIGGALRGNTVGSAPLISDLLTFPGYLLVLSVGVKLLLIRRSARHRGALLDACILGLAVGLVCWQLLVEPAIATRASPLATALLIAYPTVDVLMLLALTQLAFTDASRVVSYWLFSWAFAGLLVGDLLWNSAAAGASLSPTTVSTPYLLAYGLLGASMLHPSMRRLTENQRQLARESMPTARVAAVAAALACPAILAARGGLGLADRLQLVGVSVALSVLVILRTARAVNGFARQARQSHYAAMHDSLTGLPNREFVMDHMERSLINIVETNGAVAVLFADLDGFKLVNDSWGHDVGDQLLLLVARRLRSSVRESDLVARVGGDEFVVVISDIDPLAAVESTARRLLADLSAPFRLSHGEVFVSASMGAGWRSSAELRRAMQPTRADSRSAPPQPNPVESAPIRAIAAELLREADTAMYQAKANGRQRLEVFDVSLRQRVRNRLEMQTALRRAMDREELTLAYQPLINLATGTLTGWEALLRWNRPEAGPVSPEVFIPVAEEAGLIIPLGNWVLNEALAQLARWRHLLTGRGLGAAADALSMSVNVAERQLRDGGFVAQVAEALTESGVPAAQLCLEITESTLLVDDDASGYIIARLRHLGVDLAVDDFGTGYSALSYLTRFPFTRVKIDRSFIANMDSSRNAAAIVKAVVAMATALELELVAEGIETEGQAALLREFGCHAGQGYLFGRAVPAAEATRFLLDALTGERPPEARSAELRSAALGPAALDPESRPAALAHVPAQAGHQTLMP